MEFCGALSEQLGHVGSDHVVVTPFVHRAEVDREAQVVERLDPQVALVRDGVVHDHDVGGQRFAGEVDIGGGSHGGHPVESGGPKVGREFHVGVQAGLEPPDELGDQGALHDGGGVRLFDAEHLDAARVVGQRGDPVAARAATHLAVASGTRSPAQRGADHGAGAPGVLHGVDHQSTVVEFGDRIGGPIGRLGDLSPETHHRNGVALRVALGERERHDQQGDVAVGVEHDGLVDRHAGDRLALAGEPSSLRQPLLECSAEAGAATQDLRHRTRQVGDRDRFLIGAAADERQPEEAVRCQRHLVVVVADRSEPVLAEHLDRCRTLIGPQVELDVLCEPRQVGDAQHRWLAVVVTHERQHMGVVRIEEADVATSEHLVACAARSADASTTAARPGSTAGSPR